MTESREGIPGNQRKALSVSAAVNIAKSIISEHTFHIVGEVSELNQKPGYKAVYFTIKDESASLPCLMWISRYKSAGVPLRLGARVEVVGRFTIFAPKGRMNFDVSTLRLAGEGDLRAQVAQLALKLRNEGLMDVSRKRPVMPYPQRIGLVTSPRGAAVHDVLRTLRRRYPLAAILFAGVPVEGKQAAQGLIQGLQAVIQAGAEEVLLVRGGGSFEDLMPFNDEALARFIASSPVPIITGIGHEPDTSIADMVADLRASTPTAAAEAVSPSREDLFAMLDTLAQRMTSVFTHRISRSMNYVQAYESRPLFRDPNYLFSNDLQLADHYQTRLEQSMSHFGATDATKLEQMQLRLGRAIPQSLDDQKRLLVQATERLNSTLGSQLTVREHMLSLRSLALTQTGKTLLDPYKQCAALITSRLQDLSPLSALERGWSITKDQQGGVVRSIDQVKKGESLSVQVTDGIIDCTVADTEPSPLMAIQDLP